MQFNLDRDLCFFDVEATGLHVIRDRIIQIGIVKYPKGGGEPTEYCTYVNPGIPISQEAMDITGITAETVRNQPPFQQVAQDIYAFIADSDLSGYNCNRFDIPILMEEFARVGIDFTIDKRRVIDVQRIFYRMEPRTLRAAHQFYCGEKFTDAHDALADVKATAAVLAGQLKKYQEVDYEDDNGVMPTPVKNDMQALHDFTNDAHLLDVTQRLKYNAEGQVVFNFGKHGGRSVVEVFREEPDYYRWIMKKEFSVQVKKIVDRIFQEEVKDTIEKQS